MKTMKWFTGAAVALMLASGTQATPGDGPGGGGGGGMEPRLGGGPEIPAELQTQLDSVLASRETLLNELKALLEANADATQEERAALVENWRTDNAEALEAQRDAMQSVRQSIREWRAENRPQAVADGKAPADRGTLCDADNEALMTQMKEQRQARAQAASALKEQIQNAESATERAQIVAQHREERMEQMLQARDEAKARREQVDRDESVAALRQRLQDSADSLRTESRTRDREEAAERVSDGRDTVRDSERDVVRDQIRDQDRDRLSE